MLFLLAVNKKEAILDLISYSQTIWIAFFVQSKQMDIISVPSFSFH